MKYVKALKPLTYDHRSYGTGERFWIESGDLQAMRSAGEVEEINTHKNMIRK